MPAPSQQSWVLKPTRSSIPEMMIIVKCQLCGKRPGHLGLGVTAVHDVSPLAPGAVPYSPLRVLPTWVQVLDIVLSQLILLIPSPSWVPPSMAFLQSMETNFISEASDADDWCCFYYFVRNSLVALLEALCARIFFLRFVNIGFFLTFFFFVCVQGL